MILFFCPYPFARDLKVRVEAFDNQECWVLPVQNKFFLILAGIF